MSSAIIVSNRALREIGEASINSLSEANPRARACNENYELSRNVVLRELKPASCTARVSLAAEATAPAFGFAYSFLMPAECRFVLEVQPEGSLYKIEGRKILTDEGSIDIVYVTTAVDTTVFDENTIQAIAMHMADAMALSLTGSGTRKDRALAKYEQALRKGRANTQAESPVQNNDSQFSWLAARSR